MWPSSADAQASCIRSFRRARSWNEAVYHALCQFSEPTAAAVGQKPRYDPMANRPFIAFNVSDYAEKWLEIPEKTPQTACGLLASTGFRRDDDGNFIWDGFGANYRVLDAAVRQLDGKDQWDETPIGLVPKPEHIDIGGLKYTTTAEQLAENPRSRQRRSPARGRQPRRMA